MKLIDIAVFPAPSDAVVLESILSAENIHYFLDFENAAIMLPGSGAVLSINEHDRKRVVKIIQDAGFERFLI